MDYWRAVIVEAMPLRYLLPLIIGTLIMYFAGDLAYDAWMEKREIVAEASILTIVSVIFIWKYIVKKTKNKKVPHDVGSESARVMLN